MDNLDALIDRVRGLEGPDREVDALVHAFLENRSVRRDGDVLLGRHNNPPHDECVLGKYDDSGTFYSAHERSQGFTSSLDAVADLIERGFPKSLWDVNSYGAAAIYPNWVAGDIETKYVETHKTPALSLCLVFLIAMKEKRNV